MHFADTAGPELDEARVTGNTAFGLDLYSELKAKPANLFLSPFQHFPPRSACARLEAKGKDSGRDDESDAPCPKTAHLAFGAIVKELEMRSRNAKKRGLHAQHGPKRACGPRNGYPSKAGSIGNWSRTDYAPPGCSTWTFIFPASEERRAERSITWGREGDQGRRSRTSCPQGRRDDADTRLRADETRIYLQGKLARPVQGRKSRRISRSPRTGGKTVDGRR